MDYVRDGRKKQTKGSEKGREVRGTFPDPKEGMRFKPPNSIVFNKNLNTFQEASWYRKKHTNYKSISSVWHWRLLKLEGSLIVFILLCPSKDGMGLKRYSETYSLIPQESPQILG